MLGKLFGTEIINVVFILLLQQQMQHILITVLLYFFLTDASSSNEAVHLQQRLKSLSTELVTLRNRLHVGQTATALNSPAATGAGGCVVGANSVNTATTTTAPNAHLNGSSKVRRLLSFYRNSPLTFQIFLCTLQIICKVQSFRDISLES